MRQKFNAIQLSPLIQDYLSTEECTRRPIYLKRTTPVRHSRVGGEVTYFVQYVFSRHS